MRILLIDDDEDLRNLLSRYIRAQWPMRRSTPTIRCSAPAGRRLSAGSYDVLVLDYMLGRGDGLEWLKASSSAPTARRFCSSPAPATRSSRCAR